MILLGAGSHAREVLDMLDAEQKASCFLFDDITSDLPAHIKGVTVLTSRESATEQLLTDNRFVPATGNPLVRKQLYDSFLSAGGVPYTLCATTALVSETAIIAAGVNIMHFALISDEVKVGKACLINARAHLHHDVCVGDFCEIGPSALLLGRVTLGDFVFIGAGAILLPGVTVGKGAVVGAGAVVTKDIKPEFTVKGNPAI